MRALLWAVWLAAIAVTVLHGFTPDGLVVHGHAASPVVETAVACASVLLAALFYGRWRQRGLLLDLGTCFALTLLAIGKLVFTVVPLARGVAISADTRTSALLCGVVASVALAVASLVPDQAQAGGHRVADLVAFVLGLVVCIGGIVVTAPQISGSFAGLSGSPSTDAAGDGSITSVTLVQLFCALVLVVASMRYARRERMLGDAFFGWLAVTVALWALARVNYSWTPPRFSTDLTVGDWLRLAGYGVGVLAATYEFTGYWRRLADVAVLEERRRLARDMHDGMAQELAFIATQAKQLGKRVDDPQAEVLARAAERALDESRRGIAALTRPVDETLDVALAQQAEELSGRLGVRVLLDLQPVGSIRGDTREALLRIAREAITNAGRHGRPTKIVVHLSNHDGITLRVSDDGRGFRVDDPKHYAGGRYGVAGMRERVEALGGQIRLESKPFAGTKVEVHLP